MGAERDLTGGRGLPDTLDRVERIREVPTLQELAADPMCATGVPVGRIPTLLREVSAEEAALATAKTILAARLAAPPVPITGRAKDDLIVDVREVARLIRHSVSWVRKLGHTLPGFRQPGGKGTRVAWSRSALEDWATRPAL